MIVLKLILVQYLHLLTLIIHFPDYSVSSSGDIVITPNIK
jgi:hypothetical protein